MPGEKGRALCLGSVAGTVLPQFSVLCAYLSSIVTLFPSLPLGVVFKLLNLGFASFAMWYYYFCSLVVFPGGKAISPQNPCECEEEQYIAGCFLHSAK